MTADPPWKVTAYACACHAPSQWAQGAVSVGKTPASAWRLMVPLGQRIPWFRTLAEVEAAHGPLTPVDVDDVAALLAAVRRVRDLHSPKPGWERDWKDPAEALTLGWVPCAGCEVRGTAAYMLPDCPTLRALGDVQDTAKEAP